LGAIREKQIIARNYAQGKLPLGNGQQPKVFERDVDVGAYYEDKHKLETKEFAQEVADSGCHIVPAGSHKSRIITYLGLGKWVLHIDIWWFEKQGDLRVQDPSEGIYILPESLILKPLPTAFIGQDAYSVPHHAEFLLSRLYGRTWRTPSNTKPSFYNWVERHENKWKIREDVWMQLAQLSNKREL